MRRVVERLGAFALIACSNVDSCKGECALVRRLLESGVDEVTCMKPRLAFKARDAWRRRVIESTLTSLLDVQLLSPTLKKREHAVLEA